jgi:hypothetical protein
MGIPWLEVETVSRAVMYLVLDEGFTTGTVLEVNLGTSANRPCASRPREPSGAQRAPLGGRPRGAAVTVSPPP